ncbi:MAG: NAD(P)-dependent oxidoreductase [Polaromonas sp.]|uniref:NAD(P)-dependent oxidoreductase n=1 Tax=Polaromonas sp. TaxID=1869339 RepID=UPI002731CEDE|nr:NAD(P)-dependent oxidoreductase [Polaromonas sp.]MDP2254719.1 NAD(P)-dependent oxidoreductase [Polaromonas sp.]
MTRIGFVGLGVMGAGIASNLMKNGFPMTVYARQPGKAAPFVERGAHLAPTIAQVGARSDVVVLSVSNTQDVEEVIFGQDGLATTLARGAVVIDTSTISAKGTQAMSEKLAMQGVTLLDAPVSGGQKGATDGTLTCMVGGPLAVFEQCMPVFQGFAKTINRIGESGAGQICKACNQICVIASMLGAAEMVALCLKTGTDPMLVRAALLGGSAKSAVIENHTLRLIRRSFAPGFRADLLLKDLRLALDLENESGVFAPVTSTAEPLFTKMVESGMAGLDWSAVGALVQQMSGMDEGKA